MLYYISMNGALQNQRVGVFVDVQNMYYSGKALYNQKVDFGKILEVALGGRTLVRAIAYVIKAESDQESAFFESLKQRGLELRIKDLQTFNDGNKKGDWDVGIAMDVMRLANKLDVVVLVSGDGDFAELMKHVKALGCRAEVLAFGQSSSILLRNETDRFVDLSEIKDQILIKNRPTSTARPITRPATSPESNRSTRRPTRRPSNRPSSRPAAKRTK